MRIRAHHILCMQGFQGYGYSRNFIDNMSNVIVEIESDPELSVEVIEGADAICVACLHNKEGSCLRTERADEKARKRDSQVLEKLGLKNGDRIRAKDIFQLTQTRLRCSDIQQICGDCDWKLACLFFASSHK